MEGSYQLGFELQPLPPGGLGDLPELDLWKKATENKEKGNLSFRNGHFQDAVSKYSELIMQLRGFEEAGPRDDQLADSRLLRAQAYLNLSACFLKLDNSNSHAVNCATRALQGDKEPLEPKENVLPDASKAKALYRRGQARVQLQNYAKAREDFEAALKLQEDKAVRADLAKLCRLEKDAAKKEKAQFGGFFAKGDAFGETPQPHVAETGIKETVKLKDGLFLMPDVPDNGDVTMKQQLEKEMSSELGAGETLQEALAKEKAAFEAYEAELAEADAAPDAEPQAAA